MFPSVQLDSRRIPNEFGHSKDYCIREEVNTERTQWYGTEECVQWGNINLFHQDITIKENLSLPRKQQGLISSAEIANFDELCYDIKPSSSHLSLEELKIFESIHSEFQELISPQESSSVITINNEMKFGRSDYGEFNLPCHDTECSNAGKRLSTNDFLRLGGENFIQSRNPIVDNFELSHPYPTSLLGLSVEERRDVEIIQHLLASAEKVGEQQYSRASHFLSHCHQCSFIKGTPVQRIVYYFSKALQQKIDQETGRRTTKDSGKMQSLELQDTLINPNPSLLASYQKVPFSQVNLFTAMQVMIENISGAKRIHIIDLEVRNGLHLSILMEALAAQSDCPLEHFKVTAVGTISGHKIEETGKRLMSVAQSLKLSFSFNIVMVADMLDLNESLFKQDIRETLAVYAPCILSSMIDRPARLENLMTVIQKINPRIMIVTEVEANHNSPVFVNRFIEALFYYGALFDSMEECMDRDDQDRLISESIHCLEITNIVVFEGEERRIRHVNSNVWKAFFSRFGMVETELSRASLYQAKLLVDNFACASSCTFEMMGKSLSIGWKGTPILSVSALKFL
ncbi:GRAS transcription factor [Heracleum sosnowskyi]|uniref:GRAS transcription factor n=1 Tax=Heracleum sosnowskyi TaxID=360622 RepID=A0AAD8GNE6_9APIA|nr:GRAS transcription factor [Heracleum sosnowskyi]